MKNKYTLAVIILIGIVIGFNIFWVINYSKPYNSEDMILLSLSKDLLEKHYKKGVEFKDVYFMQSQPFIPAVVSLGILIYQNEYTPYFINILFYIVLLMVK